MSYSRKFFAPPSRRWLRGGLVLMLLASQGGAARAHPQYTAATVNRYARLVLQPGGRVRLSYTLMVGDQPALALRQRGDLNHDGQIDAQEGQQLAQALLLEVKPRLALTLDGRLLPLRFQEPLLGLAGQAVASAALSMDVAAVIDAPAGAAHTLQVEDQVNLPPVGEQEVLIDPGPGVRVLESHQGRSPGQAATTPALRFVSQGPPRSMLADRSVSVTFEEPLPPAPRGRRLALALAGMALLVSLGLWWKRRRGQ